MQTAIRLIGVTTHRQVCRCRWPLGGPVITHGLSTAHFPQSLRCISSRRTGCLYPTRRSPPPRRRRPLSLRRNMPTGDFKPRRSGWTRDFAQRPRRRPPTSSTARKQDCAPPCNPRGVWNEVATRDTGMGLAPIRFTRQGRAMVLWLLEAAGGIEMSDTLPLPERLSDVDWLRARAAASLISASAWGPEAEWCSFSERDLTDAERYNRIADALAGAAARTAALEAALAELLRTRRLHVHRGLCPDDVQPNSLDPDCEACRAIASAGVLVSRPNAQHSAQRQSGEAATQTVGPDDEADIATIAYMHGAAHANDRVRALEAENAALKTVMIAAAEEIQRHWDAHCDSDGYGPANLMRRLEEGIASEYGYTAGAFTKLDAENKRLREDAERYRFLRSSALLDCPHVYGHDDDCIIDGDDLDAAIDAARAEQEGRTNAQG